MRRSRITRGKTFVDFVRLLIVGWVSALPLFIFTSPVLGAGDSGKATLKVSRKDDERHGTYEYYTNDKLILSMSKGQSKECEFTPDPSGTTAIRLVTYSIFGTKTPGDDDVFKFVIGPSGVAQIKHVWHFGGVFSTKPARDETTYEVLNSGMDLSSLKVVLEPGAHEREVSQEIVSIPPGAKRTIKRSRTIERSVSVTDAESVEREFAVKVVLFSGAIRSKLERTRNTTYKESETIEQAVEIDGKELPKAKLVWKESSLRGKATVLVDGKLAVVPFSFPENLELHVEAAQ
jgi:hypothetical protein